MSATTTRTVTRQVQIEVLTFQPANGEALPILGDIDPTSLLQDAVHCLVTNWDGDAEQVLVGKKPEKLDESWFRPNDKGSLSIFGLNKDGKVIFGMARYTGDKRADNELEHEEHYVIKRTDKASRYS